MQPERSFFGVELKKTTNPLGTTYPLRRAFSSFPILEVNQKKKIYTSAVFVSAELNFLEIADGILKENQSPIKRPPLKTLKM